MNYSLIVLLAVLFTESALGADLAKAKLLQTNGLFDEAKRELVDVAFSATSRPEDKAEALLLLGDIAAGQGDETAAKENWTLASSVASETSASGIASDRLRSLAERTASTTSVAATPIAADSVLVIPDQKYPWAAPQLAANLGSPTVLFDGKLLDAFGAAKKQTSIAGVLEILLVTDVAFESGRVVCYRPDGGKVWEEKVMFNMGGGEERIARRFTDSLAKKIKGRKCQ